MGHTICKQSISLRQSRERTSTGKKSSSHNVYNNTNIKRQKLWTASRRLKVRIIKRSEFFCLFKRDIEIRRPWIFGRVRKARAICVEQNIKHGAVKVDTLIHH